MLNGRRVVVGISGGIAAYKAADLCSKLLKAGADVRVAMTACATRFVTPLTFETLTGNPVYSDIFDEKRSHEMEHISWAKWCDLMLVAPATANLIAKMAAGLADDPISALYLSFHGPIAVAPSMNTRMLTHPATRHNIVMLRSRGIVIIEPESGRLACGDTGSGRLASVERIMQFLETWEALSSLPAAPGEERETSGSEAESGTGLDDISTKPPGAEDFDEIPAAEPDTTLSGKVVLITSGPTHEYLDPVRFLTNPSSGRMGAALAREAARRGAEVHFVSGPVSPARLPSDCSEIHKVATAEQMLRVVKSLADTVDIFVFAAAVSDFRVASPTETKIKRTGNAFTLALVENPDIAQAIGCAKRTGQVTVGFAAETEDIETNALEKMTRKHLDVIVANDVANPRIGFDRADNEVTIYLKDGARIHVSQRAKSAVAQEIFDAILKLMGE
jgi:phosphopantothenoylcysteine decarboxylase/phosphopantothenate--cysteine ligase